LPMAFFSGAVGNIYRQFAVTLAVSISLSAFLALSLTPALTATLLKPIRGDHAHKSGFFGWFNRKFEALTLRYTGSVFGIIKKPKRWAALFLILTSLTALLFLRLPNSFIPEEDKGILFVIVSK